MAARTSSLVHPKYKTKYSIKNLSEYEQGLRDRGDVTIWFGEDAISGWTRRGERSRGAQRRYSDLAIEAALTLGLLFQLPLRRISALRAGSDTYGSAVNVVVWSSTRARPESVARRELDAAAPNRGADWATSRWLLAPCC